MKKPLKKPQRQLPNYHIHRKIEEMSSQAIEQGLLINCTRTGNSYSLHLVSGNEVLECTPIATGTLLMKILGQIQE